MVIATQNPVEDGGQPRSSAQRAGLVGYLVEVAEIAMTASHTSTNLLDDLEAASTPEIRHRGDRRLRTPPSGRSRGTAWRAVARPRRAPHLVRAAPPRTDATSSRRLRQRSAPRKSRDERPVDRATGSRTRPAGRLPRRIALPGRGVTAAGPADDLGHRVSSSPRRPQPLAQAGAGQPVTRPGCRSERGRPRAGCCCWRTIPPPALPSPALAAGHGVTYQAGCPGPAWRSTR